MTEVQLGLLGSNHGPKIVNGGVRLQSSFLICTKYHGCHAWMGQRTRGGRGGETLTVVVEGDLSQWEGTLCRDSRQGGKQGRHGRVCFLIAN